MHNSPKLMPDSRRHVLRIHPSDASTLGVADGSDVRIVSKAGEIAVPSLIVDEMMPGTVALPHGWGHSGGWRRANDAGGATSNFLASARPEDLEPLAAMSVLNGIPVRIEPLPTRMDGVAPLARELGEASTRPS